MRRQIDPALRVLPEERRIAYALAAASAAVFFIVWMPWNGGAHLTGFGLALAFSASLAFIASQGHRLWTAFGSFLLGVFGPWHWAFIFGIAYVGFAFLLGWRAHRAVKASLNADPSEPRATPLPATPKKPAPSFDSGRVTPKGTAKRKSPKRTSRTR